jgi:lysophospholipase L1-like esterase
MTYLVRVFGLMNEVFIKNINKWQSVLIILILVFGLVNCGDTPALKQFPEDAVILAFGDSLTAGNGVTQINSYPAVISQETGLKVINAGLPGEVTAAGVLRLPGLLRRYNPDLVIICHGGNDILRRLSLKQAEANLRKMVSDVKESGADVVLVAVPQFSVWGKVPDFYARVAQDFNIPLQTDILSELERDSQMKSDAVHLNASGYRQLAKAIISLMSEAGAF